MVSGTLNRETDEIEKLRRALGNHCVGTFDKMPPHTPRSAVIADELVARARQTSANVTFIEDASRLAAHGGVGAKLRFRL